MASRKIGMQRASRDAGKALMALSIDAPASREVVERLGVGVDDAYLVTAG